MARRDGKGGRREGGKEKELAQHGVHVSDRLHAMHRMRTRGLALHRARTQPTRIETRPRESSRVEARRAEAAEVIFAT